MLAWPAAAENASNGRLLYNTPFVNGQRSCGNGACHGPDPLANQNQIRNGGSAQEIASAIEIIRLMGFLKGVLTTAQLNDLAAYIRNPAAATNVTRTVLIEYQFVPLDYYFTTSRSIDISLLDAAPGWWRTGQVIHVLAEPGQTGAVSLRRYHFDRVAVNGTRSSHFYTLVPSEQTALQALNPGNADTLRLPYDEGIDSYAFAPVVEGMGGSCAAGQTPVYRLFRGAARFPDNPNHRFTTDTTVYNSMVALGWDGEGVKFCALSP